MTADVRTINGADPCLQIYAEACKEKGERGREEEERRERGRE